MCAMETVKSPHTNENLTVTYQNPETVKVCEEDGDVKISETFHMDRGSIQPISLENQDAELQTLGLSVYDQEALELGIREQVEKTLKLQERQASQIRLEKELKSVLDEISTHEQQLQKNDNLMKASSVTGSTGLSQSVSIEKNSEICRKQLQSLRLKRRAIEERQKNLNLDHPRTENDQLSPEGDGDVPGRESEIERRVRLGEMTPFGSVLGDDSKCISETGNGLSAFEKYLLEQSKYQQKQRTTSKAKSSSNCLTQNNSIKKSPLKKSVLLPKKRRNKEKLGTFTSDEYRDQIKSPGKLTSERTAMDEDEGSEYNPSDDYSDDDDDVQPSRKSKTSNKPKIKRPRIKKFVSRPEDWASDDSDWEYSDDESRAKKYRRSKKEIDDGNPDDYLDRLKIWEKNRGSEEMDSDHILDGGYKIPKNLWNKLYNYQKVGVQWLWELNEQRCGGILGDEMGLGKTIQVISFLAGLSCSKLISRHGRYQGLGPTLIVCPTTVMHQWVKEFHLWWPPFRVAVLHESGSFSGPREVLIRNVNKDNGILVTSYVGVVQHKETLVAREWHYVILDEGHKIRNPDAQVTIAAKMFRTPHRVILSGSPMQNNLKELWSLFDFVFPGKLGTLPVFLAQLAVPITQGGYSNASQVQVATAYRCATILRDAISPYLLRRIKSDVKAHIRLPPKTEQVLFCKLTEEQRRFYRAYIDSGEVERILRGQTKIFLGLVNLRKICNHPDLYSGGPKLFRGENESDLAEESRYGHWKKSGKMIVIESLLKIWKKQGHRILLFTQSRQMLCIMEAFVQKREYKYLKLDGGTSIAARQPLIAKFNQDTSYFIFLLTTRVGGLGVNLTGADRVVIYDPDWNPATDTQARERAWRIGQQKHVTVYRLVTAGTIEEKIYHRQIFKQFLTNKVLQDPKQRRFFKSNDLFELFTLKESDGDGSTETSAIFAGTGSEVKVNLLKSKRSERRQTIEKPEITFTRSKVERMKELAQKLSKRIGEFGRPPADHRAKNAKCSNLKSESCSLEAATETHCDLNTDLSSPGHSKSTSNNSICDPSSHRNTKLMWSKVNGSEPSDGNEICPGKITDKIKKRKHKNKKRKRKKSKKNALLEGVEVPFLVGRDEAKVSPTRSKDETVNSEQDDYVLKKLFKKSGLQTALRHDAIMDGGDADYVLVEGEARRVAHEAVTALKESRRQCFRAGEGIPTWTGRHGNLRPRFGSKKEVMCAVTMSSGELLSRIRARNRLLEGEGDRRPSDENVDLLADVRNFVALGASADGRATTREIVDKFKDRLPPGSSPLFKFLLREICEFHRMPSGDGVWKLRAEFKW